MNQNRLKTEYDVFITKLTQILSPWLGSGFMINGFPPEPVEIYLLLYPISRRGMTQLTWQKSLTDPAIANPDWIKPQWRKPLDCVCPRCRLPIQTLRESHRIDRLTHTGAPFIFCRCIRLGPSRIPSLSFFTDHWDIVLEAVSFFEKVALAHRLSTLSR